MRRLLVALLDTTLFWALFARCRWYRRFLGGHWELWYCEPTHSELWLDMQDGCSLDDDRRRPGACRGRPTCEDYSPPRRTSYRRIATEACS